MPVTTCPCEGDLCTNPTCDWPDPEPNVAKYTNTVTRKVGRPRLPHGLGDDSSERVTVRFGRAEYRAIARAAADEGIAVSEWIRIAVELRLSSK